MPPEITSTPIYLVVKMCFDCGWITEIDSAWMTQKDAEERLSFIDAHTGVTDPQLIVEILQMVAA